MKLKVRDDREKAYKINEEKLLRDLEKIFLPLKRLLKHLYIKC